MKATFEEQALRGKRNSLEKKKKDTKDVQEEGLVVVKTTDTAEDSVFLRVRWSQMLGHQLHMVGQGRRRNDGRCYVEKVYEEQDIGS